MSSWKRRHRPNREIHCLNEQGRVACNPRDREAAHRASHEGIATEEPGAVTCRKCRAVMRSTGALRKRAGEEDD